METQPNQQKTGFWNLVESQKGEILDFGFPIEFWKSVFLAFLHPTIWTCQSGVRTHLGLSLSIYRYSQAQSTWQSLWGKFLVEFSYELPRWEKKSKLLSLVSGKWVSPSSRSHRRRVLRGYYQEKQPLILLREYCDFICVDIRIDSTCVYRHLVLLSLPCVRPSSFSTSSPPLHPANNTSSWTSDMCLMYFMYLAYDAFTYGSCVHILMWFVSYCHSMR